MISDSTQVPYERREWTRHLDGDPAAAVTARALTAAVLSGRDAELVGDAVLVTSELVTNALAHGRPPVSITLILRTVPDPCLIIDVSDGSPDPPVRELPGDAGHFGLRIAEELARISVHPTDNGKTVRAVLPLTAPG